MEKQSAADKLQRELEDAQSQNAQLKLQVMGLQTALEDLRKTQSARRRLPDNRPAVTHKFTVGGHKGYMTWGFFEDGTPGELFITMAKEGSTVGGLMDTIGCLTSLAMQSGVSLEVLVEKFSGQRFEPSGWTSNHEMRTATSVIDYVFRWIAGYCDKKGAVKKGAQPECPAS